MSENRHSPLLDWGFRLLIVALAILWLVVPPLGAEAPRTAEPGMGPAKSEQFP